MERWNTTKSSDLYGVTEWGGGYFFVAENGDMMVAPEPFAIDRAMSIAAISSGIRERGFDMPVLLRIENILDSQITSLNETFRTRSGGRLSRPMRPGCEGIRILRGEKSE